MARRIRYPAIFDLRPGPGSHGCGDGANGCDDQERVRHANRIRQCPGQWRADQGAAEDADAVQGHHASAHIITRPELQGAGDRNVEKTAGHTQQKHARKRETNPQRQSQPNMDDAQQAAPCGDHHHARFHPRSNQQGTGYGAEAQARHHDAIQFARPAQHAEGQERHQNLEVVSRDEDHGHGRHGQRQNTVLPNVRQAFAHLAGLAFRRNGDMKTADVEHHQDEHDKAETDGIEEKTRGRAEGRNQQPTDHGSDHPSRRNHRIVQGNRVGQIRFADKVLDEAEQRGSVDGHDQAERQSGQPDHP